MYHTQKKTAQTFYLREELTEVAAIATSIIAQCTTTEPVIPVTLPQAGNEESTSQVSLTPAETNAQSTTAKAITPATSPQAENKGSTSRVTLTPAEMDAQSTTAKVITPATSPQAENKESTSQATFTPAGMDATPLWKLRMRKHCEIADEMKLAVDESEIEEEYEDPSYNPSRNLDQETESSGSVPFQ